MQTQAKLSVETTRNQAWQMFYRSWMPQHEPKAIVLLIHGLAEHSGRYMHVAKYLNKEGYAVYAMDHIGHGSSEGKRGHLDRFDDLLDGVCALRMLIERKHPHIKIFLLGHSLGGLICAHYLVEHQSHFEGCITSGAAIKPIEQPAKSLLIVNTIFSKIAPKLGMLQLDANGVSRDPEVVEQYLHDPLVYNGKISARFVAETFSSMSYVRKNATKIIIPMLIMHAGDDSLTCVEGSTILHKRISSKDKTLRIYQGLFHEIFNEPEKDTVLTEVKNWLHDH